MSRVLSAFLILTFVLLGLPTTSVQAETPPALPDCPYLYPPNDSLPPIFDSGTRPAGSNYCVWAPPGWLGDKMVIFAHGYVDPTRPAGTIPSDQLSLFDPETLTTFDLPTVVMALGYAFAVPSYSKNGLAVTEGLRDILVLASYYRSKGVQQIYLVGASEGGLVTALAIEKNPLVPTPTGELVRSFTAGVSACGPVGDFRKQVNYWGDFRVSFDYFFNRIDHFLLGDAIHISGQTISDWGIFNPISFGPLQTQIFLALEADPINTAQLLSVSQAQYDPAIPATIVPTVLGILDYNVKATNEAQVELKGNPFDNVGRTYSGSLNDAAMNQWIQANDTYQADKVALAQMKGLYDTTGDIQAPLVTLHTIYDPIIPYWHEVLYQQKVALQQSGEPLVSIPVSRFGHCAFTFGDITSAFGTAVALGTGAVP